MSVHYEIISIGQIADTLEKWIKKADPDSFFAFVKWKAEIDKIIHGKAIHKALTWLREHNLEDEDIKKLVGEKFPNIIKQLCTITSEYKNRDELFAHIAGTATPVGLASLYQSELLKTDINEISKRIDSAKQDALDAAEILRNVAQRTGEDSAAGKQTETEKDITPAKRRGALTCIKKIPKWIYILVLFLAALFTIFHYLGLLD